MTIFEAAGLLRVDWRPLIRWLVDRQLAGEPPASLAARFHEAVAEMIVAVADVTGCTQGSRSSQAMPAAWSTASAVRQG